MKILVYSISSPPEKTGIGKYNGEMINYFGELGHEVELLTTFPFYPAWKILDGYKQRFIEKENNEGVKITRLWSFLPRRVTSLKRILKELSFYLLSLFYLLFRRFKGYKPDVILYVAPPFILPFGIKSIFRKSKHVYHIQDFEVDAAIQLNMLPSFMESFLKRLEKSILKNMDLISTISEGMLRKLKTKGEFKNICLFPNWVDDHQIFPNKSIWLHQQIGVLETKKLIVYSGNIGEKQGLDKLPSIMKSFENNQDIFFVIIGEGTFKKRLTELLETSGISNYTSMGLVEKEDLNKMLNSSFIQLVLQRSEGADSFLPSKLTNILATGIPSVVTTEKGTGLYDIISKNECAVTVPENLEGIVCGIDILLKDSDLYVKVSRNAQSYAEKFLKKKAILDNFVDELFHLTKI